LERISINRRVESKVRPSVPKEQLRTLLTHISRRMGMTPSAVDLLVRSAQLGRWNKGQNIFSPEDSADFVNFLVSGVVKVSCPSGAGTVCVQLIRPGQFFGLNWYADQGQPRLFSASAFTDSTVAIITNEMMAELVANSPPPGVLQIVSFSWRVLSRLLYDKCCLLGLRLEERLVHELAVLARDFGRDTNGTVLIDLPVTHADLAEFAIASRANVARVMKRFEREGLTVRDGRKIVLTHRFFDQRYNVHVEQILRGDLFRPSQAQQRAGHAESQTTQ
jgi:CRP/FNR family cyclic AMP-dependent transcriptional regulator